MQTPATLSSVSYGRSQPDWFGYEDEQDPRDVSRVEDDFFDDHDTTGPWVEPGSDGYVANSPSGLATNHDGEWFGDHYEMYTAEKSVPFSEQSVSHLDNRNDEWGPNQHLYDNQRARGGPVGYGNDDRGYSNGGYHQPDRHHPQESSNSIAYNSYGQFAAEHVEDEYYREPTGSDEDWIDDYYDDDYGYGDERSGRSGQEERYDLHDDEVYPARKGIRSTNRRLPGPKRRYQPQLNADHELITQARELALLVVPALLVVLVVRLLVLTPFVIPTNSMQPTLDLQDRILVNKLSYQLGDIQRGHVIVANVAGTDGVERSIVKRVIGLPGETIEIRDNTVIIDGSVALDESSYLAEDEIEENFGPIQVPQGELFLLGDNRDESEDSTQSLGTVPEDAVLGRAFARFWPINRIDVL